MSGVLDLIFFSYWNVEIGENVFWSVDVLGFGYVSLVFWGDCVFVVIVVSLVGDVIFKLGFYGDGEVDLDCFEY